MSTYNTYDRYGKFRENGTIRLVPFVKIPKKDTDIIITYEKGKTRLDIESYRYYNNPNYGWLILMANPSLGSMEFSIPDNAPVRIPYPLNSTLSQYQTALDNYIKNYGLD